VTYLFPPSKLDKWLNAPIKTLLLSYPRSGNSWMRYCLEALSQRPTHGDTSKRGPAKIRTLMIQDPAYTIKHLLCPIGMLVPLNIDVEQPVIAHKRHGLHQADYGNGRQLVVIVRDYKEAVLRNRCYASHTKWTLRPDWRDAFTRELSRYLQPLVAYAQWSGPKHLVYYEDLLTEPAPTLSALLDFLGISTDGITAFVADIDQHRERSVRLYTTAMPHGSRTLGRGIDKHSQSLTEADRAWMVAEAAKFAPLACLARYCVI
jgi:hypothetical protein